MKMLIVLPFLLALGLCLGVQQVKAGAPAPVQKTAPSAAKSQAKNAQQALPAANEDQKTPQAQKTEAAQAGVEQEADEGGVMIDSKSDEDSAARAEEARARSSAAAEDRSAPSGIPASYGQLKGAFNDGGRNLLIFENEEGVIAFVQIFVSKNEVTWKLISTIRRSAD